MAAPPNTLYTAIGRRKPVTHIGTVDPRLLTADEAATLCAMAYVRVDDNRVRHHSATISAIVQYLERMVSVNSLIYTDQLRLFMRRLDMAARQAWMLRSSRPTDHLTNITCLADIGCSVAAGADTVAAATAMPTWHDGTRYASLARSIEARANNLGASASRLEHEAAVIYSLVLYVCAASSIVNEHVRWLPMVSGIWHERLTSFVGVYDDVAVPAHPTDPKPTTRSAVTQSQRLATVRGKALTKARALKAAANPKAPKGTAKKRVRTKYGISVAAAERNARRSEWGRAMADAAAATARAAALAEAETIYAKKIQEAIEQTKREIMQASAQPTEESVVVPVSPVAPAEPIAPVIVVPATPPAGPTTPSPLQLPEPAAPQVELGGDEMPFDSQLDNFRLAWGSSSPSSSEEPALGYNAWD